MKTSVVSILVAVIVFVATAPARAQDLDVSAFYGTFAGSGIAENADSLYFGVTVRDLDVTIGPDGDGFFVEWTSIIRGGGDPNNPDVRKRTSRVAFDPSERSGIFRGRDGSDAVAGDPVAWAYVADTTLTVHIMAIDDDGNYRIQSYDRTLNGAGMQLDFASRTNGEASRRVEGRLVKASN